MRFTRICCLSIAACCHNRLHALFMGRHNGYRLRIGRHSEPGHVYMITTACEKRRRVFRQERAARIVMTELAQRSNEGHCVNLAYVVMPDHIHWMLQLTATGELSQVVARTKGRSAFQISEKTGIAGRIWQSGFHDHAIRREEDLVSLANYVIHNPVRAGLVAAPDQYPYWWSTWHSPDRA